MNDHKIIDTNLLKNKFTFSDVSENTKNKLIAGGLSFAGIATAIGLSRIFMSEEHTSPVVSREEFSEDISESTAIVNEAEEAVEYPEANEAIIAEEVEPDIETIYEEVEYVESEYSISFDSEATFAQNIDSDMDFSSAFAQAREEVGMGGFFNWNDNSYSTYTYEEWNAMSPDDQQAFFADVASKSQLDASTWMVEENTPSIEDSINDETMVTEDMETIDSSDIEFEDGSGEEIDTQTTLDSNTDVETITIVPPATYGSADINSDNIVDAIVIDKDNDGHADLYALDEDFDGTFETFRINEDGDDDLDVFIIDHGSDGIDDTDTIEEISVVVDMEDFIVMDDASELDGLDFIDELIDIEDDEIQEDNSSLDTGFDDPGL